MAKKKLSALKQLADSLAAEELVDDYIRSQPRYHLEGESGVACLENLFQALGYDDLTSFLADNPGAQEALEQFVRENLPGCKEWQEGLRENI
ncbi:MAG: hypothetical protein M0R80_23640 [Proteobacteria bacterium]|jgi:hypothetical protein|nr:hypothetical protein [Pseudomonadota bacterium]